MDLVKPDIPSFNYYRYFFMSCLQNEAILESLFEEILSELYIKHKNDVISRKELEEIAATKAQEQFDDMCQ